MACPLFVSADERKDRVQIQIQPSAMIRRKYNEIVRTCRETESPIFLTKNGEEDLVVLAVEQFFREEDRLLLREKLVDIEKRRRTGVKDLSARAVCARLREMIERYKWLELTQESEYPERRKATLEERSETGEK